MPREMSDQLREVIDQSSFGTDDVKQARQSVTEEEIATLQHKIAQKRGTTMPDTIEELKELLSNATPGPWKLDPETGGIKNSASDNVVRGDANRDGDEVWLEWSFGADHMLAVLAPELTAEYLRLLRELADFRAALQDGATNAELTPIDHSWCEAARDGIDRILNGETND